MIDIPVDTIVRPLLIELRSVPAYFCLVDEAKFDDGLPWYHDIYQFLRFGAYPETATTKDKRALRQLATRFVIYHASIYRVIREVHAGVCGSHMGGYMLALVMSSSWSPLITSPKWVEATSYARLTSSRVASFIRSPIIYRYGIPHELILKRRVHFRVDVDTLLQKYGIQHHRSFAYRSQTNGVVEAANKNIKRILRRMIETSRDWSKKLSFALWAYQTSFCTSTGATPYSLVYGIEAVLPVEIEMGSLRLNLLDERRLRAVDHVRAYQRKMAHVFKNRVKPRPLQRGDMVMMVIRELIRDPRGKFRPNWSRPYFIRELTLEGVAWLMDLDGKPILGAEQCRSTEEVLCLRPWS
uniref:Integrase catalytic domain-containing protein n=1 Tax=Vitis vinifera TaxID=29760 RepID=A5BAQ9_VITVI|nr:hypothetical protein VITISV_025721 [Vitis vinifera]